MQWKKNKWILLITFFSGVLICFIATRFQYFEIKKELDVPALIMGVLGLGIGLYIADNIQNKNNKNQNKYTFLESKLDLCWTKFSSLAKIISVNDKVDLETLSGFSQDIIHQLGFIRNVFNGSEINSGCIDRLEVELDEFEELFDDLKTEENIKYYSGKKDVINNKIKIINKSFSEVLRVIQNIE
ncbi:hypothetical protein ACFO3O_04580 [Dokdonia ponticola]|uniref:Uncharacterized protein n=1 Tax=Dokdonia ponticola TaxID=2041041 RepID=A0ABV9HUH8_9FLAO